jgi:hypothetical protein
MNSCRVARRIASTAPCQNNRAGAVNVRTLATKVFDWTYQPFPIGARAARRSVLDGKRWMIAERFECVWGEVGEWLFPLRRGARRVACAGAAVATPSIASSLVTKRRSKDAA